MSILIKILKWKTKFSFQNKNNWIYKYSTLTFDITPFTLCTFVFIREVIFSYQYDDLKN